jgi:hypothetical protein
MMQLHHEPGKSVRNRSCVPVAAKAIDSSMSLAVFKPSNPNVTINRTVRGMGTQPLFQGRSAFIRHNAVRWTHCIGSRPAQASSCADASGILPSSE